MARYVMQRITLRKIYVIRLATKVGGGQEMLNRLPEMRTRALIIRKCIVILVLQELRQWVIRCWFRLYSLLVVISLVCLCLALLSAPAEMR